MSFIKFVERKKEEIYNRGQSFDEAKMLGAYPHSSRQPAIFHYFLTKLEREVPESSKAEILFELVRSAYRDYVVKLEESIPPKILSVRQLADGMLLQAYTAKAMRSSSERSEGDTGFFCDDEIKKLADEFIKDYESCNFSYQDLVDKYENTALDNEKDIE